MLNFKLSPKNLLAYLAPIYLALSLATYTHPTTPEEMVKTSWGMLSNANLTEKDIVNILKLTKDVAITKSIDLALIMQELKNKCDNEIKYHQSKIDQKFNYYSLISWTIGSLAGFGLTYFFHKKYIEPLYKELQTLRLTTIGPLSAANRYIDAIVQPRCNEINNRIQNLRKLKAFLFFLSSLSLFKPLSLIFEHGDSLDRKEEHKPKIERLRLILTAIDNVNFN